MVGLTRMKEIVEVLSPELRAFCDENNDELLDLLEVPLPRRCTRAGALHAGLRQP
jgi:hypothetical protein